ncbi:MAG: hypothetical protein LQ341_007125, partial [Variospora aurantia]
MLAEVVETLTSKIEAQKGTKSIIRLDHAFSAFSGDVIGRICWEDKKDLLDEPDIGRDWIANAIPPKLILGVLPSAQSFGEYSKLAKEQIIRAKQAKLDHDQKGTQMDSEGLLFRHIVNSDMPESERSENRLAQEAQVIVGGGT